MARKGKGLGKNKGEGRKRDGHPTTPRDEHVIGHTADVVSSLTFTVDPLRAITIDEINPLSIRRELTHARPGKTDKVITSMPVAISLSRAAISEIYSFTTMSYMP